MLGLVKKVMKQVCGPFDIQCTQSLTNNDRIADDLLPVFSLSTVELAQMLLRVPKLTPRGPLPTNC